MKAELAYQKMYLIRKFEEKSFELFSDGHIKGTIHTCIGQEAVAVGVGANVNLEKDIVFSNHRGHGHFLATYGGEKVFELFSEIMGKQTGICAGTGGTQHIHYKNYYSNGILGGIVPISTGMAFAEKNKNSKAITVTFLGDGTFGEGVVYESFNIASKWSLPVVFCIENNFYAQTTPVEMAHSGTLSERGLLFGIKTFKDTSNDITSIYNTAMEAFAFVRTEGIPVILYTETYRLSPHSKGDDFRDKKEIEKMKAIDPLIKVEHLLNKNVVNKIKVKTDKIINEAAKKAIESPKSKFIDLN